MFNPSREQVRHFFCEAWRKHRARLPLEGAEVTAADLILEHPEYHALLENPAAAIEREFTPEGGQMNPFLHLSLHLAIAEQISIDQPRGIRAIYQALRARLDVHDAEHAILECLGEALWRAQRQGGGIDATAYLDCLRRAAGS
ncbi:MAG: DUF1841 family protein [Candidatus Accumulibacter sp.]|uniref:DUF1841 family protein n=1 Tax=Accumulibacter sp. TaxID=2053492 RepID=UPI0025FC269A|nr:DUF1841 family protein [Accumulibacter sp.]MCM8597388.1 DUF1841 family protein [Accumulibacter sp.]MCM8662185.1 DUF1841 family protein [Accumulibacter sp.]